MYVKLNCGFGLCSVTGWLDFWKLQKGRGQKKNYWVIDCVVGLGLDLFITKIFETSDKFTTNCFSTLFLYLYKLMKVFLHYQSAPSRSSSSCKTISINSALLLPFKTSLRAFFFCCEKICKQSYWFGPLMFISAADSKSPRA